MAENEYEAQPEAPDLGESAQLETAESLVGPPGKDPLDAGYVPPDRPFALDDEGVTAQAQRDRETLDERLRRERPDVTDDGGAPVTDEDRSGRLEAASTNLGAETAESLDATDVGIDGGAASAEEAAVHERQAPGPA